jgi:hypothetical protein
MATTSSDIGKLALLRPKPAGCIVPATACISKKSDASRPIGTTVCDIAIAKFVL